MKLNGAQIVIEELCRQGVSTIFGYPGGTVLPLYDAIYENAHRIQHVLAAHEQGAAHAADGYARAKNEVGVVIATSGPGATNLVTGIANAYLDSVPLIAITGNVPVGLLGRDSFQEVDIVGITQPIVKHSFMVHDIKNLSQSLQEAFSIANSGRKGPVLIDIPKSVQIDLLEYVPYEIEETTITSITPDITQALAMIKDSQKPFIYAGGGVLAGDACAEVLALSQRISAPIGLSMMGLTAIPHAYELNLGMCGMHGTYAANMAQSQCDLMIAIGVRFSDRATGNIKEYKKKCTIIHIDIDLAEIDKNVSPQMELCGEAKAIVAALLEKLPPQKRDTWQKEIVAFKEERQKRKATAFTPQAIIQCVHDRFSTPNTIVATDVGQHQMWTLLFYPFAKPRTLLSSGGLGAMGFGMGAAIGGCMASGKEKTVLFTGDGSFGMNCNELATAVSQNLPLCIVILNNGVLGMVRQWQTLFYEKHYSHTTLERKTDFVALGKAYGATGYQATSLSTLEFALENASKDGPTVIDCRIDIDEMVFPMIPPGGSVKNMVVRR